MSTDLVSVKRPLSKRPGAASLCGVEWQGRQDSNPRPAVLEFVHGHIALYAVIRLRPFGKPLTAYWCHAP